MSKGSYVKYTVLTESIRSSSWKYTVLLQKVYGIWTETIRSGKVYGPRKLEEYGQIVHVKERIFSSEPTYVLSGHDRIFPVRTVYFEGPYTFKNGIQYFSR